MSNYLTRIKNNQITDSTILANTKIVPGSIVGSLFNSNLIMTSDVTITGNLTVQGASTYLTVASTNTFVNDPLIILNNAFSGTNTYDIGLLINRGNQLATAIIWNELGEQFELLYTTDDGSTYGSINNSGYANLKLGNLTIEGATAFSGNILATDIFGDNLTLTGDAAINGGDLITTSTTFNLLNTTATTINFAGSSTLLTIGSSLGVANIQNATTNILGNATVLGHVTLEGVTSTGATGTGNLVFSNNPVLVTPNIGTPSYATLTNATGLPVSTGISGLASGMATFLATPSSSNLAATVTDETGTGNLVFSNNPVLVTPNIGTPSYATLTNATGLPVSTGISGLASGMATFLATPSSSNLAATVTDETGTGLLVFATSPTMSTSIVAGTSSFDLLNTTATTVNFAGNATALTIGSIAGTTTIRNALTTLNGNATVSGTLGVTGNTTLTGDLAINGGDLTTTATTFNLINAVATTVNAFGSAGNITVGANTGTIILNNPTVIGSQTTQNLYNTVATTVNAFGQASTIIIGATTGTANIRNATTNIIGNATVGGNLSVSGRVTLEGVTSTGATGTGNLVFSNSPVLVTPNIGTPSYANLTNAINLPLLSISGLASGMATFLATPSSANLISTVTDETGTGNLVFSNSPTMSTSIVAGTSSFNLLNTTATTVNFAGAATTLNLGAASGTISLNNATLSLPNVTAITVGQTAIAFANTTVTTVNAFGSATSLVLAATTGTTTIRNNLVAGGNLTLSGTTQSTNKDTGAVVIEGGMGIEKNLNIGGDVGTLGNILISATTQSNSVSSGALVVLGGAGIAGNLNVGGDALILGNLTVQGNVTTLNTATLDVEDINITVAKGAASSAEADGAGLTVDGAGATLLYTDATLSWDLNKTTRITAEISAIDNTTGALQIVGGVGVRQSLYARDINATVIGNVTPAAATFTTLTSQGTTTLGPLSSTSINNTIIGNVTPAAATFTTLTSQGTTTLGGVTAASINATVIGNVTPAAATFTSLNATTLQTTSTANVGALTAASINGTVIGNVLPAAGTFTTLESANLTVINNANLSPSGALIINPATVGAINNVNIGQTTAGTGSFTTLQSTGTTTLGPLSSTSINNTIIGNVTPLAATFTSLNATTLQTTSTANVGALTAASINGTVIGNVLPASGTFTNFTAQGNTLLGLTSATAINNTPIGNATPSTGVFTTLASQNTTTLGPTTATAINNTPIGNAIPSSAAFTTLEASGIVQFTSNSEATSVGTGALRIDGGTSISGNLFIGGNVNFIGSSYVLTGNSGVFYGDINGFDALYAGVVGYTQLPSTIFQSSANSNTYAQNNFENLNTGDKASTDWVATAGAGDDYSHYINMGIVTGNWNGTQDNSLTNALGPHDGYLYVQGNIATSDGGNLVIGASTPGIKKVSVIVGGNTASNISAVFFNPNTDSTDQSTGALVLTGGLGVNGNLNAGLTHIYSGLTVDESLLARDINGTVIGNVIPASGSFTTLDNTGFANLGLIVATAINATPIGNGQPSTGEFTSLIASDIIYANSNVSSTTTSSGGLVVLSGVGIGENLNVGGTGIFGAPLNFSPQNANLQYAGDSNSTIQFVVQNLNDGDSASTDIVMYASNSAYYIDSGVNSGTYSDPINDVTGVNDAYVYNAGGNLVIGTDTAAKQIVFHTGGSTISQIRAEISDEGLIITPTTPATSTSSGALVVGGGVGVGSNLWVANGAVINAAQSTDNFTVKGAVSTSLIHANSNYGAVIIGGSNASPQLGATLKVNSTDAMMVPVGTTSERPSNTGNVDVAGMLRYNTSLSYLEYYDGTKWSTASGDTTFTIITSEQFNGDGANVTYILGSSTSTNGTVVSINGVLQIPTLAYSILNGNELTFTEAPAEDDLIDVRILSTTQTVSEVSSPNGLNTFRGDNDLGAGLYTGTSNSTKILRFNVTPTGKINIANGSKVTYDQTPQAIDSSSTPIIIDQFPVAEYTSAKYIVQVKDGANVESYESLVVTNGIDAYLNTYGVVNTGNAMGTLSANIVSGNVQIYYTSTVSVTSNVKVYSTYIV